MATYIQYGLCCPSPAPWVQSDVPSEVAKRLCDVSAAGSPRERPITAGDNEASLGRVWDHRKLLERGFLLCTASIYHYDNILPDAGMCCACIPHVRALLCTLRAMPGMSRGYSWYVVTTRRLRDAFGTTKSFSRSVFCFGQPNFIIYIGFTPRGGF